MPFEPGKSGNPSGKQKLKPWREALDRALAQYETETIKAGEALRAIADRVVGLAIAGDKEAYKEIAYRLDGPIAQDVNLGVDSAAVEGLSIFGAFLAQAIGAAQSSNPEAVDTGGLVLPAEVRPTTH
jgi:hypothetical protein